MSNLTHLFKVGQKVTYRNNDFDAVKRNIPCIVKENISRPYHYHRHGNRHGFMD